MNILDKIMGVEEASETWTLSPGYIKNLCAEGKIQARKIGKTWVISKDQENPKNKK
jgi:Helix-turn-helix domain